MDGEHWKLIVDKVIRRTKSRDLRWAVTNEGPDRTLSFSTSIDETTTLNIWGYEKNYSYELRLIKQTAGQPFNESKRATRKDKAEGIDFRGLFEAAKHQVWDIAREDAYETVMAYLAEATSAERGAEAGLEEPSHPVSDLGAMGHGRYFLYSEDAELIALLRDRTAAGAIHWSFVEANTGGVQTLQADLQDLTVLLECKAKGKAGEATRNSEYVLDVSNDGDFWARAFMARNQKNTHDMWLLADEIHSIVAAQSREEDAAFEKIVRESLIHEILASLDDPKNR